MRVLFSGGGTGGHINPALAMADIIKMNIPDAEIAFVGTPKGMENSLIPQAGYKLYHVEVEGIRRSLSPKNVKSLYLALTSPAKAKKIIKEFKPDIHSSFPIIYLCTIEGCIPFFIIKICQ